MRKSLEEHSSQTVVNLLYCIQHIVTMAHCVVGISKTADSTDNCESAIVYEW